MSSKSIFFILVRATSLKSGLRKLCSGEHELVLLINEKKLGTLSEAQQEVFSEIRSIVDFSPASLLHEVEAVLAARPGSQRVRFLTNDEGCLPMVGALRDRFKTGEASLETVLRFKDKSLMKKALRAGDPELALPRFRVAEPEQYRRDPEAYLRELESELGYPIFSKPIDSAASCFTRLLRDRRELQAWLEELGERGNFELDEFVTGALFHCDSLVQDGRVLFKKVSRYNVPCAEFLTGKPIGSITLPDESAEAGSIGEYHDRVLRALAPVSDGAFHLEVFRRPSGELVFLEIAARTPGAYAPQTFAKAFGLSLEEAHLLLQMGSDGREACRPTSRGFSAWMWYPVRKGIVTELIPPLLTCTFEIDWKIKVGDHLGDPSELGDMAVGIKLWSDDFAALERDFESLARHVPYRVES